MDNHGQSRTGITALDQLGANFDAVLRGIDEREATTNVVELPTRARRRPLPALLAVAAVLLVAVATLTYSLLAGGGSTLTVDKAIADVAHAASVQTLPPDDAYTYTHARIFESQRLIAPPAGAKSDAGAPITYFVTSERQSWLSIAREGLVQVHRLNIAFANAADERAANSTLRAGSDTVTTRYPAIGSYRVGSRTYSRAEIERFPTDPSAIYNQLNAELSASRESDRALAMWNALTEPLTSAAAPLPPKLRAGLVSAIGMIPGVTTLGKTQTPRGQEGIGFALETNGTAQKIIFDADTAAVLFEQSKVTDPQTAKIRGVTANSTLSSYELIEQRVTDTLPNLQADPPAAAKTATRPKA